MKVQKFLEIITTGFQISIVTSVVYFIVFLKGMNNMVDMVSKRMLDSFNKFKPREKTENESLSSIGDMNRLLKSNNYKKNQDFMQKNDESLFSIKEDLPPVILPEQKIRDSLTCYCLQSTGNINEPRVNVTNFALKNVFDSKIHVKRNSLLDKIFNHLSVAYHCKKFLYPQVEGVVINDERIKHAVDKMTIQEYQELKDDDDEVYNTLLKRNHDRAVKILRDMRSKLSDFLLRFTAWILHKVLPCFLKAIVIQPSHIEMLKQASKSDLPLIFLPLHRSHLDYILVSFLMLINDIRSPLVAAGDNLRIPFFGSLLRGVGAFYIKRRIDPIVGKKDMLYRTILQTYMNESLRAGHNIEFFLEGGRTRTGKPCMPKYGILSIIVEAVMNGTIEDALLVPVSINYEKLVDGNFIREQLGQPKEMESFSSAFKGIWHVLNSNYGMVRFNCNKPFSLRKLIKTFNTNGKIPTPFNKTLKSNPSTSSLYGTDCVSDEHKNIVETISKHVIFDCAHSEAIMSTNAVAFLLLNKFRNGAKMEDLILEMDNLRKELYSKNKEIGFSGDYLDVINYAIDIMGPGLIRKDKMNNEELIKPVATLPNVIELSYYSNAIMSSFCLDSAIALSIGKLDLSRGYILKDDLVETCLELCNLLQNEFIFCKPCQSLEMNIINCIENLVARHEIFTVEDIDYRIERRANLDIDSDDDVPFKPIKYNINPESQDYLVYLAGLLMPLIETYTVTAECLEKLVGRTLLENELVSSILEEIKKQLANRIIEYEESVCVDPVKNALKVFQKMEILEVHSENRIRLCYLRENHDNSQSVTNLVDKVNQFRSIPSLKSISKDT